MVKIQDTIIYRALWPDVQNWINSNLKDISERDIENEDLASKLVHVAAEAYFSNEEDYFPNREDQLGLNTLQPSMELSLLLRGIKKADRHGYATKEIREYEQTQLLAS